MVPLHQKENKKVTVRMKGQNPMSKENKQQLEERPAGKGCHHDGEKRGVQKREKESPIPRARGIIEGGSYHLGCALVEGAVGGGENWVPGDHIRSRRQVGGRSWKRAMLGNSGEKETKGERPSDQKSQ